MELKKGKNYVDNALLYQSFVEWYDARMKAIEQDKPEPEPPNYIAECIVLVPTRLATKSNFAGYSFRDEMVGDAIENIVQYYRNFDIHKSKNPFAYFTQISYYAFIRRILKEKKQSYVKHKMIQNSDLLHTIATQGHDDSEYHLSVFETMKMNLKPELEAYFESDKKPKERKRKNNKSIEDLIDVTPESENIIVDALESIGNIFEGDA